MSHVKQSEENDLEKEQQQSKQEKEYQLNVVADMLSDYIMQTHLKNEKN